MFREQPVEAISEALLDSGSTFLSVGTAVTCPGASRAWTSKARFSKVRRDVHSHCLAACFLWSDTRATSPSTVPKTKLRIKPG